MVVGFNRLSLVPGVSRRPRTWAHAGASIVGALTKQAAAGSTPEWESQEDHGESEA
jgi:hypothetical protein